LGSGLNRLTTDAAQVRENDERLARMKAMATDSRQRVVDLGQDLVRLQWEKDGVEIALEQNQQRIKTATADDSKLLHYLRQDWTTHGWLVLGVFVVALLAPALWRLRRS
jgi:hypothetical protein